MPVLYTHGPENTRDYLLYSGYPIHYGTPMQSVMLPTMEYLVLFETDPGLCAVVAYGIDELLPDVVLEEGIPSRYAPYALAFHANLLGAPAKPAVFELKDISLRS